MRRSKINAKSQLLAFLVVLLCWTQVGATTIQEVAQSRYWHLLLHYRNDFWGLERSEIDSKPYFLSRIGNREALAELEASLSAFERPASDELGPYQQHPQCVFPERYRFLKAQQLLKVADVPCPALSKWQNGVKAKKVTLVYAASYMGNPASMFGHTFLRLDAGGTEILDAGVSFDAVPENDNKITFALKGLLGGYTGIFSQQPYYQKIKAYSHLENRDLWEIELNLTQEQVDRLVLHLWELSNATFDYFFFDENCSYQLLSLLEIANPEWDLRQQFSVMTVPIDTVRAIAKISDSIRSVKIRKSVFSRLSDRYESLSNPQKIKFDKIRNDGKKFVDEPGNQELALIDTLLDWQSYQSTNRSEGTAIDSDLEARLLLARASKTVELVSQPEAKPTIFLGHRTSKAGFFFGTENGNERVGIGVRGVLHDELDPSPGYVSASSLVIGRLNMSYFTAQKKLALDEFTFFEIINRPAVSALRMPPSWAIGLKIERPIDTQCIDCLAGSFRFGIGLTKNIGSDRSTISLMAHIRSEVSNAFLKQFDQTYRMSPSIQAISNFEFTNELHVEVSAEQFWRLARISGVSSRDTLISGTVAGLILQDMEIRLRWERRFLPDGATTGLGVTFAHYF